MTMEKQPFEDVSCIEHGDFPLQCQFSGSIYKTKSWTWTKSWWTQWEKWVICSFDVSLMTHEVCGGAGWFLKNCNTPLGWTASITTGCPLTNDKLEKTRGSLKHPSGNLETNQSFSFDPWKLAIYIRKGVFLNYHFTPAMSMMQGVFNLDFLPNTPGFAFWSLQSLPFPGWHPIRCSPKCWSLHPEIASGLVPCRPLYRYDFVLRTL